MKPIADRFGRVVLARPLVVFLLSVAVGSGAIWIASTLEFNTSFAGLLPDELPELQEVRRLQRLAGGTTEMVVALEGDDPERRMTLARRIVVRLRQLDVVRRADVEFPVDFFLDRRLLLLSLAQLRKLDESIGEEIRRAKARANPLYVDLEGDEGPDPWAAVERADRAEMLPRRSYSSPDGRYLFVRVKPTGASSDFGSAGEVLDRIKRAVAATNPAEYGVRVRYAGGIVVNQDQHRRMIGDLRRASVVALAAILSLIMLHVRRLGSPVILAIPLLFGVSITLAITALTIGQLNLISGFLVSALLGVGIDFEIHLYLRYLEQLTVQPTRTEAMRQAINRTLPACIVAAGTTAAAFYAMTISDFRGFREYGLIAGTGVLVTLVTTFVMLPPLALFLGRKGRPVKQVPPGGGFRRGVAWGMVIVGGVTLLLGIVYGKRVAWFNDFRKLRGDSPVAEFSDYVSDLLGGTLSPAAFHVRTLEQARRVERYIERQAAQPGSNVGRHVSLGTLVPRDTARKMKLIRGIRAKLQHVLEQDLTREDRDKVKQALELARVEPWAVADVPAVFRNQFLTADGAGQFVIVWPAAPLFVGPEIMRWGRTLNRMRTELRARGIPVQILDENRLGARVLVKMRQDAPWVITSGSIAVVLILLLHFRNLWRVLMVGGALAVALGWLAGALYQGGIDIHVFNLAVIPTIIGLGIDNGVHIMHRYRQEGRGSLAKVVATTGAASFLATATTAFGFGAAITASHAGIRSLGWLTILGLTCAFLASTALMPSVIRLLEDRFPRLFFDRLPGADPGAGEAPTPEGAPRSRSGA